MSVATVGVPHDIASASGSPKPSCTDAVTSSFASL